MPQTQTNPYRAASQPTGTPLDEQQCTVRQYVTIGDDAEFIESENGERVIRNAVFSTEDIDSHASIIRVAGWDLKRFERNPVLDWMHASVGRDKCDPDDLLGQALNVIADTNAKRLVGELHFLSDDINPKAGKVFRMMKAKILRGLSVALIPREVNWKMLLPNGELVDEPPNTMEGDLEFYKLRKAGATSLAEIVRAELTSIGVVLVPSNPNTLANGIDAARTARPARMPEAEVQRRVACAAVRAAVKWAVLPLSDASWDADKALANVRVAATNTDGSVDWKRYAEAFAFVSDEKPEEFGSYKLPHHDVIDGELSTVRSGVIAAGNALHASSDGIADSELAAVRSHLEQHFAEFGLTAPWAQSKAAQPSEGMQSMAISDEQKTSVMKAAGIAVDAIGAASKAIEAGDDEAAITKTCAEAYDACEACAHEFGKLVPEYVKEKEDAEHEDAEGEGDGTEKSIAWIDELTATHGEAAQRGVIEAWRKSHGELVEARAVIADLQSKLGIAVRSTREQQVSKLLDDAVRKITPAERKSYEARCYQSDADVQWLEAHLRTLSDRIELSEPTKQPAAPAGELSAEERAVAKQFGLTLEQYIEHKRKLNGEQTGEDHDDE